jgi:hypothetical protein
MFGPAATERKLTLSSCLEQMNRLTGFNISLRELATVFWECSGIESVGDATLGELIVSYADFSRVFANSPESKPMAAFKL